jgi:UDP-N-acetylmuramoylalanine--D-glutamate ligase
VRVADTRAAPPGSDECVAVCPRRVHPGEFSDEALLAASTCWRFSPGLDPRLMVVIHAAPRGMPVVGEIELFARGAACGDLGCGRGPVLAITGTNGKTTTTALTGHLLRATGKTRGVAGNISPRR